MRKIMTGFGVAATAAMVVIAASAPAHALSFNLTGDSAEVSVDIDDIGDNLKFTVRVVPDSTGNVADLRGFFFDLLNDDQSFLNTLSIVNPQQQVAGGSFTGTTFGNVTFKTNDVIALGPGNTLQGGGTARFDAGFDIGQQGLKGGADDIRAIMFELASSSAGVSNNLGLDLFGAPRYSSGIRVGVRAQSVGPEGGAREGSAKIVGEVPTPALLPGLLGMGAAALRKRRQETAETA